MQAQAQLHGRLSEAKGAGGAGWQSRRRLAALARGRAVSCAAAERPRPQLLRLLLLLRAVAARPAAVVGRCAAVLDTQQRLCTGQRRLDLLCAVSGAQRLVLLQAIKHVGGSCHGQSVAQQARRRRRRRGRGGGRRWVGAARGCRSQIRSSASPLAASCATGLCSLVELRAWLGCRPTAGRKERTRSRTAEKHVERSLCVQGSASCSKFVRRTLRGGGRPARAVRVGRAYGREPVRFPVGICTWAGQARKACQHSTGSIHAHPSYALASAGRRRRATWTDDQVLVEHALMLAL